MVTPSDVPRTEDQLHLGQSYKGKVKLSNVEIIASTGRKEIGGKVKFNFSAVYITTLTYSHQSFLITKMI